MKVINRLAIYILILSLILTGCSGRTVQTQSPDHDAEIVDSVETDFNKMSEEKKAEQIKAREAIEKQRKAESDVSEPRPCRRDRALQ